MSENENQQTLDLVGEQRLVVEKHPGKNVLRVVGVDGLTRFSMEITATGPVLRFEGAGLTVQTEGSLVIDAGRLDLRGRDGVAITSGGDALIQVDGDLHTRARIQNIVAELGNVNVKANDDVKLNGERIMVNC